MADVVVSRGRVLIIAGSDSGGGAGIQADIKTVTALGGYASTAITALTAQNTEGVFGIVDVEPNFVKQQAGVVISDIGVDAVKIGMLHSSDIINAVSELLIEYEVKVPIVLDPVMVAKGGQNLLESSALQNLKNKMLPLSYVVTPNIPEAEILSGIKIHSLDDMKNAATIIYQMGAKNVLIKGGHMSGLDVKDLLYNGNDFTVFESNRIDTRHTHGTGCTLSSAIACSLAKGLSLAESVKIARRYVFEAIRTAPGFGKGSGPLNHSHTVCIIE